MKAWIKFFIAPIITLAFVSCDSKNDGDIQSISAKKIDSIKIVKDTMAISSIQDIKVFASYTKNCEGFYGRDYIPQDSVRTVINYAYKTNEVCGSESYPAFDIIRFEPRKVGKYYFKFWNGKDAAGQSLWIEKQIVVQ